MDTASGTADTFGLLAARRRRRRSGHGALIDLRQLGNLMHLDREGHSL